MAEQAELGPVDVMVVRFPGSKFTGGIVGPIRKLVASDTIHIIDLVFVQKGEDGSVSAVEVEELDGDAAAAYGDLDGEVGELLSDEDLVLAAELLEPGDSAALLVWENTWAAKAASAIRAADGEVVMFERIPGDVARAAVDEHDAAVAAS